jgi:hypothetical protein
VKLYESAKTSGAAIVADTSITRVVVDLTKTASV